MREEELEEKLYDLMREYQQPVETKGYSNKVIAGVSGLALGVLAFGIWVGSHFISPGPAQVPTTTPTLEVITMKETPTPSPTIESTFTPAYTPTKEPTPTYTLTATPTNTPSPTSTPTPTSIPTATPTNTPIPPPTPIPDTPPGSVLSLGQMWRQGHAGLTLTEVHYVFLWADNFPVDFIYRNYSDQSTLLYLDVDQFSAVDNLGNTWPTREIYNKSQWITREVRPGGSYNSYVVFIVDEQYIARPDVDNLIVTVDGLSSIQNAKWKIDILH